jgi:hypothetical protein
MFKVSITSRAEREQASADPFFKSAALLTGHAQAPRTYKKRSALAA